ncbi:MAG: phosphatidate cytidylyltransferase, partial [Hyphomicrobium sp.]
MTDDAPAGLATTAKPGNWRDLKPRILAGIALAAVAFLLLALGPQPFAVLVLAVTLAMSWEWGRMVRNTSLDMPFAVQAIATTIAVMLSVMGMPALGLAVVVIGTIVVFALGFGTESGLSAQGVLYVGLPAVMLLWLRSDGALGFWAVLLVVACVAATDTAAFFTGRQVGGPKLWPAVSPNKTWSGLIGGVTASALAAMALAQGVPGASSGRLALIGIVLGLVAQAGDLAESALKRLFSVKDTSSLIPGHGGVMDRMDGVVAAAVT